MSYHLNDSIFEKYEWFQRNKLLHHKHHMKTYRNYNLIDNTSDKLHKTYSN